MDRSGRTPSLEAVAEALTKDEIATSVKERFNSYVDSTSGDCWLWLSTLAPPDGRARVTVLGRSFPATWIAWWIEHGSLPQRGIFVCHSCDNPACVNPHHLWLGTPKDNTQDALAKGRLSFPRVHRRPRMTAQKAADVKRRLLQGDTARQISERLDVAPHTIRNIKLGKAWAHVDPWAE